MNYKSWLWIPMVVVIILLEIIKYPGEVGPLDVLGALIVAFVIQWIFNKTFNKPQEITNETKLLKQKENMPDKRKSKKK